METAPNTLVYLIDKVSKNTPNAACLLAPNKKPLSFIQLMVLIEETHHYLNKQGFDNSSRIALLLPNTVEAAAAFLSISASCTVVPLNPAATDVELKQFTQLIKPHAIITIAGLRQKIEGIGNLFSIPLIELVSDDQKGAGYFVLKGEVSNRNSLSNYVSGNDIAIILLTSGSTAAPKIIPITHEHYCHYMTEVVKIRSATSVDRYLNLAYLHHLQGINGICVPIVVGGSCVCSSTEKSLLSIEYFEEFSPTFYTALPVQHQQLLSQAIAKNFVFNGSLRAIVTGSAAMSEHLALSLEHLFNAPVIDTYGMSETLGICSNPLPPDRRKSRSVGIVLPSVDITILGQNDEPVILNIEGEIVVTSPWMFTGYLENDELNKAAFCQYGFKTGDIGYFDADNYLFITGRVNEAINRGGEKVSPAEIDQVLLSHPNITEAVTFAISDKTLGEDIVAAVVTNDKTITPDIIKNFIKDKLSSQKIPSKIFVTEYIPKGPTGKIQRNKMAGYFNSYFHKKNEKIKSLPILTIDQIHQALTILWSKLLPAKTCIKEGESFFDLGGDSFLFFQLTVLVEQELGIFFPENVLLQGQTLRQQTVHLQSVINSSKTQYNPPRGLSSSDFKRLLTFANGKKEKRHTEHPLIFPYNKHLPGIPLYFVSGGKYLAAHIKSRPFYDLTSGFNVINLDANNMAALADYYVDELLKLTPSGPYLLGGYCSGALLAFEIAKRLLAQQKQVPLLIMVDQGLPCFYTGDIAFLPFNSNCIIDELSRLEKSDILKEYYPGSWTLDVIQNEHYPELYYMSAMVVAERIEARIQQKLENNIINSLPDYSRRCDIQAVLDKQSFEEIVFRMTVTNSSGHLWPAGQVCITYHWLSNIGRVILYAENKVTINEALNPGQKYSFLYSVNKLKESAEASLVFSVIDNFGSWFTSSCVLVITRTINTYNSSPLDLVSINKIEEQGHLTQAIQHYYHHIFTYDSDSSEVLLKLAKIVRLARGAQNAIDIYKQALKKHSSAADSSHIQQDLAENYMSLGDFDAAVFHAKKALQLNHQDYLSLSYLGLAHAHNKNYSTASKVFKKITRELKGRYSKEVVFNIGKFIEIISANSKDNYGYITMFSKILIKHNPYNPINYYIYANNLIAMGKYAEAEQIIFGGIKIYPYISAGYELLYMLYMQQEHFSKAIAIKYKICELKPFCIEQHRQLLQLLNHDQRSQDATDLQKKMGQLTT